MTAGVDIAGAVAPAPTAAPPADGRADRTPRSGHASHAGKTTGAKAHAAAKGTDAGESFAAFDAQLDAALPDSTGEPSTRAAKPAAKGAPPNAADETKSGERQADQAATAVVLMPWTFLPPQVATPTGDAAAGTVPATTDAAVSSTAGIKADETCAGGTTAEATNAASASAPARVPAFAKTIAAGDGGDAEPAQDVASATGVRSAKHGHARTATHDTASPDAASAPDAALAVDGSKTTGEESAAQIEPRQADATSQATGSDRPVPTATTTREDRSAAAPVSAAGADGSTAPDAAGPDAVAAQHGEPLAERAPIQTGDQAQVAVQEAVAAGQPAATPPAHATGTARSGQPASSVPRVAGGSDKLPQPGRSKTSVPRSSTHVEASPAQNHGKEHRTPYIDASAYVGSVDERRGSASPDDAMPPAGQAVAAPKPSDVTVHQQHAAGVVMAAPPTVTAPISGLAATAAGAAEVVMSGDVPVMTAGDVPDPDTPNRLVQSLRMQFLRGGGEAVVELRPDHLGPVTVSLRVEQGNVEARITAGNPVVAEWLQANHDSLRESLQASGLTLDRLHVDRDGQSPDRRQRREAPQRQRFKAASETQSTFELTI